VSSRDDGDVAELPVHSLDERLDDFRVAVGVLLSDDLVDIAEMHAVDDGQDGIELLRGEAGLAGVVLIEVELEVMMGDPESHEESHIVHKIADETPVWQATQRREMLHRDLLQAAQETTKQADVSLEIFGENAPADVIRARRVGVVVCEGFGRATHIEGDGVLKARKAMLNDETRARSLCIIGHPFYYDLEWNLPRLVEAGRGSSAEIAQGALADIFSNSIGVVITISADILVVRTRAIPSNTVTVFKIRDYVRGRCLSTTSKTRKEGRGRGKGQGGMMPCTTGRWNPRNYTRWGVHEGPLHHGRRRGGRSITRVVTTPRALRHLQKKKYQ
jgi:hypothetical protein